MFAVKMIIAAVRTLAANHPEATYEQGDADACYYTSGNVTACLTKGCIVGQAILKAFPVLEPSLQAIDDNPSLALGRDATGGVGARALLIALGFFSEQLGQVDEISWLACLQLEQDTGKTWSEAVRASDQEYPLQ